MTPVLMNCVNKHSLGTNSRKQRQLQLVHCAVYLEKTKNPYHSSHDSSAHTFSLHIRDKLCVLLLHIKKEHDANQTHQFYLWNKLRTKVALHKALACQLGT